jgi:hypothetical protein
MALKSSGYSVVRRILSRQSEWFVKLNTHTHTHTHTQSNRYLMQRKSSKKNVCNFRKETSAYAFIIPWCRESLFRVGTWVRVVQPRDRLSIFGRKSLSQCHIMQVISGFNSASSLVRPGISYLWCKFLLIVEFSNALPRLNISLLN